MVSEQNKRERQAEGLEMRGCGVVSINLPSQVMEVEGVSALVSLCKKPAV